MRRARSRLLVGGVLAAAALAWALPARAAEPAEPAKRQDASAAAAKLVQAAMEDELAGRDDQRQALLGEALRKSPGYQPAHWLLGEVSEAGKWQRPEDVQRQAQQDPRLAEFKRRRAEVKDPAGCVALARWCHKNRLVDEERVAWLAVLALAPGQAEAVKALGLVPYQGQWLTQGEVSRWKAQVQAFAKALDKWRPLVAAWLKATERHDSPAVQAVTGQIASISDSAEMLALERVLWQQVGSKREHQRPYEEMVAALVAALAESPQQPATESLVRQALFSKSEKVRRSATAALKARRPEGYVPMLLSGMATPLEFSFQIEPGVGGYAISRFSIFREGSLADERYTWANSPVLSGDTIMLVDPNTARAALQALSSDARMDNISAMAGMTGPQIEGRAVASASAAAQQDVASAAEVQRINQQTAERNAKIGAVLIQTTGKDLGDDPIAWWNWWWKEYNEMAFSTGPGSPPDDGASAGSGDSGKPQYEYDNDRHPDVGRRIDLYRCSCFARGTPAWTQSGAVPIEEIKPGDRVLAQDAGTGELAYKPVLGVTVRPPCACIKIGTGRQAITATPGHAFWVVGYGWRMAKQLAVGDRLHMPSESLAVESLQKVPAAEAHQTMHNLIVAEAGTYFVGQRPVLVHDITPQGPVTAGLPGMRPGTAVAAPRAAAPAGAE